MALPTETTRKPAQIIPNTTVFRCWEVNRANRVQPGAFAHLEEGDGKLSK